MAQIWARGLHNPCLLGGPQCSTRQKNLKWPKTGPDDYVTPALVDKEAVYGLTCPPCPPPPPWETWATGKRVDQPPPPPQVHSLVTKTPPHHGMMKGGPQVTPSASQHHPCATTPRDCCHNPPPPSERKLSSMQATAHMHICVVIPTSALAMMLYNTTYGQPATCSPEEGLTKSHYGVTHAHHSPPSKPRAIVKRVRTPAQSGEPPPKVVKPSLPLSGAKLPPQKGEKKPALLPGQNHWPPFCGAPPPPPKETQFR